jgi:Zn-finger nucleic acid-binding protein
MRCPTCVTDLRVTERQGVQLDWCPRCQGVWLERGELDTIIERSRADPVGGRSVFGGAGGPAPRPRQGSGECGLSRVEFYDFG